MNEQKLSGLFINCVEANDSIHESGKMAFQCLLGSERYSLDYVEITPDKVTIPTHYDFYFFNYHCITMAWLITKSIKEILPGVKMTMVLEVAPNDPFVYCSPDDFDVYCVLDPTLNIHKENVFAFPRPLETLDETIVYEPKEIPVIGSFGFATPGKGFGHVIDAVNKEFDKAVVRINIPYSTYMDESGFYAKQLAQMCKEKAKDGVEVIVTHDYMTKEELIKWCGQNTLNCFLYDRNQPGLAATTDQAITSGRPLITSKNNTFRHILKFIKPFPYQSLKEAIEHTQKDVEEIQKAWSPEKFRERFEEVLDNFHFETDRKKDSKTVELTVVPSKDSTFLDKLRNKVAIRTRLRKLSKMIGLSKTPKPKPPVSHSQFGEDLIIYNLLNDLSIKSISYLDIGANDPEFFSNTCLFYERGFTGVLVEPNAALCEKLRNNRPKDCVLNVGIGADENVSEADFYLFSEENDGLSTFSLKEAKHWEEVGMDGIKRMIKQVVKMPLLSVNHVIENYFTECPDFVSIDVEGWDLKILGTFDFAKYSPPVFCVETLAYNKDGSTYRNQQIYDLFDSKGYFPYKETFANTIFVNKNLYDFYLYQREARCS
jgi:FkbM family methyltransferase